METPAAFGAPPYKAPRLTSSETLQDIANQLLDCAKRIANSTWMANYGPVGVLHYSRAKQLEKYIKIQSWSLPAID